MTDHIPETNPIDTAPTSGDPTTPATAPSTEKRLPLVLVGIVLALPVLYMGLRAFRAPASSAASAQVQTDPVAAAEKLAQQQPTPANRINLSLAYIQANRPDAAVPVLLRLTHEDPRNALAWNNLCVAHNMQSDFGHSLDECRRAIAIDPTFQLAKNNLQWALQQIVKARAAVDAAEAVPPAQRTPGSYLDEGLNLLHVGDYDRALGLWQPLFAREPRNALVANDIGVAYMMQGHPVDALNWFHRALSIDPTLQLAQNNIAWAERERAGTPVQ